VFAGASDGSAASASRLSPKPTPPSQLPPLTVAVVNWNGRHLLTDCLGSLAESGYDPLRVLMVDNGSTDDSVDFVQRHYPTVEIIRSPENLRWAGGNNLAIRRVQDEGLGGGYLLLLNNDTIVPQGSLERLVEALDAESTAWLATPRICFAHDPARAWYDGGYVGRYTGWLGHHGVRMLTGRLDSAQRFVSFGSGCALLLGEQALAQVGELDESYFLYGEDTDYCLRTTAAGGRILHVPRALVLHKVSSALGSDSAHKVYLRSRSHIHLLRRHWPVARRPLLTVTVGAYLGALTVWHLWHGRTTTALAVARGALDELRGAPIDLSG